MIINCLDQWGTVLCIASRGGSGRQRDQIAFPKVRDRVGRLGEHVPHVLGLPATVQRKCALCKKLELAKKVDVDCLAEMGQCAQDL